jgi:hypothetical protein
MNFLVHFLRSPLVGDLFLEKFEYFTISHLVPEVSSDEVKRKTLTILRLI